MSTNLTCLPTEPANTFKSFEEVDYYIPLLCYEPKRHAQSAVENDPSMADAWSNLGSAYHHEDHLEDALGW